MMDFLRFRFPFNSPHYGRRPCHRKKHERPFSFPAFGKTYRADERNCKLIGPRTTAVIRRGALPCTLPSCWSCCGSFFVRGRCVQKAHTAAKKPWCGVALLLPVTLPMSCEARHGLGGRTQRRRLSHPDGFAVCSRALYAFPCFANSRNSDTASQVGLETPSTCVAFSLRGVLTFTIPSSTAYDP